MGELRWFEVAVAVTGVLVMTSLGPACSEFESTDPAGDGGTGSATDGAGTGGGGAQVKCDGVICAAGEVCCTTVDTKGDIASAQCSAKAACATTFFACDETADCPSGQICCADTVGGSYAWPSSACQVGACSGSDRQLCGAASDCSSGACVPNPADLAPKGLSACE